jgi:hypothetical protein
MNVWIWALGICIAALGALFMFMLGVLRDHMGRDAKVHERVAVHEDKLKDLQGLPIEMAVLKSKHDELKSNMDKLKDVRHAILDEVSHKLSGWYLELVKMIKGDK